MNYKAILAQAGREEGREEGCEEAQEGPSELVGEQTCRARVLHKGTPHVSWKTCSLGHTEPLQNGYLSIRSSCFAFRRTVTVLG